jgi:hypothetical protein
METIGALENRYLGPASGHKAQPTAEEMDPERWQVPEEVMTCTHFLKCAAVSEKL